MPSYFSSCRVLLTFGFAFSPCPHSYHCNLQLRQTLGAGALLIGLLPKLLYIYLTSFPQHQAYCVINVLLRNTNMFIGCRIVSCQSHKYEMWADISEQTFCLWQEFAVKIYCTSPLKKSFFQSLLLYIHAMHKAATQYEVPLESNQFPINQLALLC